MNKTAKKAPFYPKSHLLAASGVATLLSLALLIFPSREVEAKKTFISIDMEPAIERATESLSEAVFEEGVDAANGLTVKSEEPFLLHSGAETSGQSIADSSKDSGNNEAKEPLKRITVARGDTLSTLFEKAGLSVATVQDILGSSTEAEQLVQLKPGQVFEFQLDKEGQLLTLSHKINHLETLRLEKTANGYALQKDKQKPETTSAYAYGTIDSSLFLAAQKAGLSHGLAVELTNIFGYDIDFALDLRKGDSFELLYEEKTIKGKRTGGGKILAARFTNQGKTYTAIRYKNAQGGTKYYTANGDTMRKEFIRTPVDFARISSRFSIGRKHPILNKIRAHKGVDYAAPSGTPIKSAGDGKIVLAGRNGGYGNTVIVQHGQRYQTLYAHMQGFAKGIRNGASVKQGQIIGYIGTTGLSTGPHLHYEFQVDGQHIDPLSQKLAMTNPLTKDEKQLFLKFSKPLLAQMDEKRSVTLALSQQ
ncbi:peptidoglycan DD-metalloendopeptidase family protein [Azomonas macrocytogenes]|uniref:Murein DD-endopeptidase MepM/ murein hydrolase activator NlpD n=1 Tax=Azomonas macrocytogenes TaxID=69962 RepID=A0A839T3N2_AZOMA|nr:peptidoglycan DD-metalloendopeptidase family protein [Azomonas macrocytogenes]MBB3102954.1 murein DD-endopeptidase MepM/ murein hydrolase activator NlpD [Azomonas macrocytogenes]